MSETIGTSATLMANSDKPKTIVLHADSGNDATIQVSWTTSDVSQYDELGPGDSLYFYNFVGQISGKAVSGTQTYTVQQGQGR